MNQPDRRLDPRCDTRVQATIDGAGFDSLTFQTSELSRTGAFLQRPNPDSPLPAVGAVIQLVLHWPIQTHMPPIRLEATVMRQTDDGVGVRFEIKG